MGRKIVGWLMIAAAALIAFFAMFDGLLWATIEPIIGNIWTVALDPIMFVAIGAGIVVAHRLKRDAALSADASDGRRLETAALFYGFLVLGILFMSNWMNILSLGEGESQRDSRLVTWYFINAVMPVMVGYCGVLLIRDGE